MLCLDTTTVITLAEQRLLSEATTTSTQYICVTVHLPVGIRPVAAKYRNSAQMQELIVRVLHSHVHVLGK
jgi:hypothetical protein